MLLLFATLVLQCSHLMAGLYSLWSSSLLFPPYILPFPLSYEVLIFALSALLFLPPCLCASLSITTLLSLFQLARICFKAAVIGTCWDGCTDGVCLFPYELFQPYIFKSFFNPLTPYTHAVAGKSNDIVWIILVFCMNWAWNVIWPSPKS